MEDVPNIPSIENLAYTAFTTSGRAAIFQALLQLKLPPGSTVLVPTYHCPTMVAPVPLAKLNIAYFGLHADGLPDLGSIDTATATRSRAMIVSHYFGLARSLAEVRQWCDQHGIALIEDCAHCYFGEAGGRPIGAWGDYSTASLSKFFPVSEGGVLASAHRPITDLRLTPPGIKAQLKGWIDVLDLATKYQRFFGINKLLALMLGLKNSYRRLDHKAAPTTAAVPDMMQDCDMARITQAPLGASMTLKSILPRGRIIARRQGNFAIYARNFQDVPGARPLFPLSTAQSSRVAPYVFPLWVDEPDRIYQALREQELPVFRWDRIWHGTPHLEGDVGPLWSHHVLQLLCHQDLSRTDVDRISQALLAMLPSPPPSTVSPIRP